MTESELVQRARNAGIATEYHDWLGRRVEVPAETLAAILDVLEQPIPAPVADAAPDSAACEHEPDVARAEQRQPGQPQTGQPQPGQRQPGQPQPGQPHLALPEQRDWGFTVQLYSVRSTGSWGHGDLHDLAELARWSATELGAGFVLVNPLHAAEPLPPVSASPYLPMTRLFTSPLYLRVEDILEYGPLPAAEKQKIAELAAPLRAASTTPDLIDRDAVWTAKRQALELIRQAPLTEARQAALDRFRAEQGQSLVDWTAWCAIAERHGSDYRSWPPELADPQQGRSAVLQDPDLRAAADFHAWLQWQADLQLGAAQQAATTAGMRYGIIHDLAVGVHPGGADAWAQPGLLISEFSVGAPPDGFNQLGQDWSQPPWHPGWLAALRYRPLAQLFGSALRHGGGIRVDHVMGLTRLWWIPVGQSPERGAYVSYDAAASVGALTTAAASAGAVAIGEDLGTVEPWVSRYLADHGVLGTMMLWFAHTGDGTPKQPENWRRDCMATVGTHDVPPVYGFVTGEQVEVRARLGLLKTSEERERTESASTIARWRLALEHQGLLQPGAAPSPAEFTIALYGYLRRTPALLLGVSLADAVGEVRTQNIPGTSTEYPNWQIPLCDDRGCSVLLEHLSASPLLREVCAAVGATERSAAGHS